MRASTSQAAFAAAPLLCGLSGDVQSHAFVERYDLPLPLWHYLAGAGITVAVSFFAMAWVLDAKRASLLDVRLAFRHSALWRALRHRGVTETLGALPVALLAAGIAAGFLGTQGEPTDNLLPVLVWILWWVGLTYVCALIGNVWPVLNPWAAVARWTAALASRPGWRPPRVELPDCVGTWPAVVLAYSVFTWCAMTLFGIDEWLRRGDPFTQFFALVGRFAPFDREGALRPYGAGLVQTEPVTRAELAFIVLVLATVTFDGIKETVFWSDLSAKLSEAMYRWGWLDALGNVGASVLLKTAGLALLPLLFLAIYLLTSLWMSAAGPAPRRGGEWMARRFVLSLVPIAIGYHLAHYLSYLLIHGQAAVPLASDPLGRGWDLFGTRGFEPDTAVVGAQFVWNTCLASIVLGHVAALVAAHVTALRLFGETRAARRSQYPLVALMVAYTMVSLWVLSQPIVQH